MQRRWILTTMLLIGSMLAAQAAHSAPPYRQSPDEPELVMGNNTFAFDLYHQVITESNDNLIFSPFSISQAFGMLMAGARDTTEAQMAATLHYTLPQDRLHAAFSALNTNLTMREAPDEELAGTGEPLQLNIANSLFAQQDFPVLDSYTSLLEAFYNGGLQLLDFVNAPEAARETINSWIEDKTEDKIQDMLPPETIHSATRLVLVNAIYFNGSWLRPFNEAATQDAPFTLLDGSTVDVPMMSQQESFGYQRGEGFQAVELSYYGADMAMLIVLPDEGQFEAIQAGLTNEQFETIRGSLAWTDMQLVMPRFEFETGLNLNDTLTALGLTDVFDPSLANLTGMYDKAAVGDNLFVSAALHKAFIGVDEAGTEAAAATAIIMDLAMAPAPGEPLELRLDHPFIYTIYDRQTGSILFLGQVMDPAS